MDRFFELLLYTPEAAPYLIALGVLLACGLGLPIPEDLTLFTMGYLAYNGIVDIKLSILVCMVGVLLGDSIIYGIGRKYGARLAQKGIFAKLMPPERMERTREKFMRMGNKVIFAARFMPGLRAPTYFSAGTLRLPFRVFFFYDGLASLLSVPILTYATYYFGDQIDRVIAIARSVQHGIVFLIVGLVAVLVLKHYIMKKREAAKSA